MAPDSSVSTGQLEWDANCAEILESVEDFIESQEPDHDPTDNWAGDSWRVGRSGTHRSRIAGKAEAALPVWVVARAQRHYDRENGDD